MKRVLYGSIAVLVVFIGLGFAYKNATDVTVRYYGGLAWRAPLALVLVAALVVGIMLGFAAGLNRLVRVRHQLAVARKQVRQMEQEVANLRALPIKDVL
ncbi:lipopolysaccharide assembly protein LapA domain-containing protein [Acidiferrobacter sp.]|uniref:lipopolysaccharide assembly protein LapA domain-containing protein n=1 Tax=Acidiferrobacter sp. TaxID=1872107 RepID=UPI0026377F25|nr:lipopolysaccharide assembly protein LapA domain-containing protein [Acidiferrobacter sp.]